MMRSGTIYCAMNGKVIGDKATNSIGCDSIMDEMRMERKMILKSNEKGAFVTMDGDSK